VNIGIVVPTYNEAINIVLLLKALKKQALKISDVSFLVAIVDDNSPDGTSKIAKKLGKELSDPHFKVVVIDRTKKDGYGKACVEGMNYLLSKKVDFVLSMDADLSHNPKYIKSFIAASKDHQLVIGSRYVPGGATPEWPMQRKMLSKYGNYYARLFLNKEISDYTGGFNLYSSGLLKEVDLNSIESTGYGFLIELKYKVSNKAKSIYQVPIVFYDRQHGKSKMPKRSTLIKNFLLVPKLRMQTKK
jgi:dolichol-phosphate mannosyltransferase